jgi:hypothetical protein
MAAGQFSNAKSILSLATILRTGVILAVLVSVTCYIMALSNNHLDYFIPMISDCGSRPPEKYIFHYGCITSSILLSIAGVGIYMTDEKYRYKVTLFTALLGCVGLAGLGSVSLLENLTLHMSFATLFFISFAVFIILFTYHSSVKGIRRSQLLTRYALTVVNCLCVVTFLILHVDYHRFITIIAAMEWYNYLCVNIFCTCVCV